MPGDRPHARAEQRAKEHSMRRMEAVRRVLSRTGRTAEALAEVEEWELELDWLRIALAEPCAECGHIDWRSDAEAERDA